MHHQCFRPVRTQFFADKSTSSALGLARRDNTTCSTVVQYCRTERQVLSRLYSTVCMLRAYYICIWSVHALSTSLPKSQVSSLKSQVSSLSGLPKSQVSSLKYLSLFFVFFHFMTSLPALTVLTRAAAKIDFRHSKGALFITIHSV